MNWQLKNPAGIVCFLVMNAEPNAQVWLDIGNPPKNQLARFGSVPLGSKPYCGTYGLSLNPLVIQVYPATDANKSNPRASSEDAPSEPLAIQIVANSKICVGIFPDHSTTPNKLTTRIVDCTLTNHFTGPAREAAQAGECKH